MVPRDLVITNQTSLVSVDTELDKLTRAEIEFQIASEVRAEEKQEQSETVDLGFGGIAFSSSSVRGDGVVKGAQGDHSTAYVLYLQRVIGLVQKYVAAAAEKGSYSVSDLLSDLSSWHSVQEYLLNSFSCLPSKEAGESQIVNLTLTNKISQLRLSCNATIAALHNNVNCAKQLKNDKSLFDEKTQELIGGLNIEILNDFIRKTRKDYFYTVTKTVSQETILLQNKMQYTAFQKIIGHAADKGEGGRIAHSIEQLRQYNNELKNATTQSSAINIDVDFVVYHAVRLFYFPKVINPGDGKDLSVRTNDIKILGFVIARHLWAIFAAFESFDQNETIKSAIASKFIKYMIDKPQALESIKVTKNGKHEIITMKNVCQGWGLTDEDIIGAYKDLQAVPSTNTIDSASSATGGMNEARAKTKALQIDDVESFSKFILDVFINCSIANKKTIPSSKDFSLMTSPKTEFSSSINDDKMSLTDDSFFGSSTPIKPLVLEEGARINSAESVSNIHFQESSVKPSSKGKIERILNSIRELNDADKTEFYSLLNKEGSNISSDAPGKMGEKLLSQNGSFFNSMSEKSYSYIPENFTSVKKMAQRTANNLTKPLLYMSGQVTLAQKGFRGLVVNAGIEGLVNGLKQLAMPSCSLDGTTIISSMIRPRY